MTEELRKLCENAWDWCQKYGKDYVTISVCDGVVSGWVRPDDEDYDKANLFIIKENV